MPSPAHLKLLDGLERLRAVGERLLQVLAVGHAQVLQPREHRRGPGPGPGPARSPIATALRRRRRGAPSSPLARAAGAARAPLPGALQFAQVPPAARLRLNHSRPLPPRTAGPPANATRPETLPPRAEVPRRGAAPGSADAGDRQRGPAFRPRPRCVATPPPAAASPARGAAARPFWAQTHPRGPVVRRAGVPGVRGGRGTAAGRGTVAVLMNFGAGLLAARLLFILKSPPAASQPPLDAEKRPSSGKGPGRNGGARGRSAGPPDFRFLWAGAPPVSARPPSRREPVLRAAGRSVPSRSRRLGARAWARRESRASRRERAGAGPAQPRAPCAPGSCCAPARARGLGYCDRRGSCARDPPAFAGASWNRACSR